MRVKCNLLSHKRVDVTLQVTIDMLSEKGTKVYRTLRKGGHKQYAVTSPYNKNKLLIFLILSIY